MYSPWEQASIKSAIDIMGALVVFLDRQGRIVEFNHACERLTGYDEADVKGRFLWDFLLLAEERAGVVAVFERLRAGDFPNQYENHWVSKSGEAHLVTWSNTALVDANGQVTLIIGTGIDITERRRANEALQRRDAILEAVAFAAEEFLKTTDFNQSIQAVLPRLATAANATHAYLIQVLRQPAAAPAIKVQHVWAAPDSEPVALPEFNLEQLASFDIWRDQLLQRQPIHGLVKDLQPFQSTELSHAFKALAIVPIFEGAEIWGIMGFGHSTKEHRWQGPEVDALRAAADTFGAALLRWKSVEERQAQERFLTTLANITSLSLQIPQVETMLQTLADHITKIIDADDCYITLWNSVDQTSSPIAASSGLREAFRATGRRPAKETVTGAALRLKRTLVVEDIRASSYVSAAVAENFQASSGIAVPVMAGTEPLGVFFLTFRQPHRFTPEEIARCEQATQQVALAIAKARLLDSEQAARKRAETLQTITQALSSSIHLSDVLDTIITQLQRVLPYDSVSIQEIQGTYSVIIACRGFADQSQILGMRFDLTSDDTPNRQVITSKQPLILADAPATYPGFAAVAGAPAGIHSWLGVPLIIGGQAIGMISLDKQIPGFYTREHQDLAQAFAAQAAIAIQNAHLFAETQRRAAQQKALNSIIAAAATAENLPSLAATTIDRILATVNLQQGGIWAAGHYHRVGIPAVLLAGIAANKADLTEKPPVTLAIVDWAGPDVPDIVRWMAEPALTAGIRSSFFTPVIADGQPIGGLVLCSTSPRPWPAEETLLLQAVAQQIGTAALRLQLVQEVRQQAQQLQQVLDTIADGMLLLNGERRIILTNPAGREYLRLLCQAQAGDILAQIGGLPVEAFLEAGASATWRDLVIEHPERRVFQANARAVDGSIDRQNAGWVMSIAEVTRERRRQEQVQAQERLAALGRMAAGIAHDFNNILQGIIGFADIVARQPDVGETTLRRVERISQEGYRGAELVRQILDFSRQSPPSLQPVAVETLVPYFAEPWRGMLPAHVELAVEGDDVSCTVQADASQLGHVFTNLVVNSIEAMPEGGRLTVRVRVLELIPGAQVPVAKMSPGGWVAISVSDTGCGIAADDLPRVFEPFFTTKRTGRSAGLGLARAYGIIKQHDGFVSVDSQVGVGTTVTVYLPAVAPPAPQRLQD